MYRQIFAIYVNVGQIWLNKLQNFPQRQIREFLYKTYFWRETHIFLLFKL